MLRGHYDECLAVQISIGIGLLAFVAGVYFGITWAAILAGILTYLNCKRLWDLRR